MSDPRCTCGESDCPICAALEHRPWTPKAGDPIAADIAMMMERDAEERARIYARWERWQTIRRYLLVLLLAFLGGLIGGLISAYTILLTFN